MSRTMYSGVHLDRLTIPGYVHIRAGYVHIRAITVSPAARGGWPMRQPVYAR
jgi:hypothetical protein